ncbi:MAG: 5-methylcytosine-specific restriction endonuclease system specificity protein McrC [Caldisericia bacterium]
MLSHAFRALKREDYQKLATVEFDNIFDLFAGILSIGVAHQIKRGIYKDYLEKTEFVSTLSGKINITESVKSLESTRGKLVCIFDEFTENVFVNRIIKSTLLLLIKQKDVAEERKKSIKKLLFYFSGIDILDLKQVRWRTIAYDRNNYTYQLLINICYLVYRELLFGTEKGDLKFAKYGFKELPWLFEKFVLNYYRKHYPSFTASATEIKWDTDDDMFLPKMRTDITLRSGERTLIIDTKFYESGAMRSVHGGADKYVSSNLYQIYSYVKNEDKENSGNISGLLLYAKTENESIPEKMYNIGGNKIGVKHLDLNVEFSKIKQKLDEIATDWVGYNSYSD